MPRDELPLREGGPYGAADRLVRCAGLLRFGLLVLAEAVADGEQGGLGAILQA